MEEIDQPQPPIIKLNWDELDIGLRDNQKEALRFIAAGFGNIEASKKIGMHRSIVSRWLHDSIAFVNAYERVIDEVRRYNTAMLEYVTTTAWLRIHQYMLFDPAELIKDVKAKNIPPTIAKTLITEQGRMLRHVAGGIRPQTYIVEHDVTPALLRATENAAGVVADRLAQLKTDEKVIDIEASVTEYRRAIAPPVPQVLEGQITVDWEAGKLQCPECQKWVVDLKRHCNRSHGLRMNDLREKYSLAQDIPSSFENAVRKPLHAGS